ncbi:MAG: hypothetical protein Q9162_004145 [Coniocarpon cinnabarinum]
MTPKVFFTGATGYVGGDALARLVEAHPNWQYRALVRDEAKGSVLSKAHPSIEIVEGDLDSEALLEREAKNADIVLNLASSDHVAATNALVKGLRQHSVQAPGFLIHCSGTGVLVYPDMDNGTFGESSNEIWDDVKDIEKIRHIPSHAPHRNIDELVFAASQNDDQKVKTAIVCPPLIYGQSRGTGNPRSIQLPSLARAMIESKQVFQVGKGQSLWSAIHVQDLSNVFLLLAEAAARGGGTASWNEHGYYFTVSDEADFKWGDASTALGQILRDKGVVFHATPQHFHAEQAASFHPYGAVLWGTNSMSRASRAKTELGWSPTHRAMFDALEDVVNVELAAQRKD